MDFNYDNQNRDNKKAMIFMICFIAFIILLAILIVAGKNKNKDNKPSPTPEVTNSTPAPTEEPKGVPLSELAQSLYDDVYQILGCNDTYYFTPSTPGVFKSDLIDARTVLGQCKTSSYILWYGSDLSTAMLQGQYMMDIGIYKSTSGYHELLVYFNVSEYRGEYTVASISFDYLAID